MMNRESLKTTNRSDILLFLLCCFRRIFNHDNVVKLQGVGIKGPRSFMVHEYLSNGNMQDMITLYDCILSS